MTEINAFINLCIGNIAAGAAIMLLAATVARLLRVQLD